MDWCVNKVFSKRLINSLGMSEKGDAEPSTYTGLLKRKANTAWPDFHPHLRDHRPKEGEPPWSLEGWPSCSRCPCQDLDPTRVVEVGVGRGSTGMELKQQHLTRVLGALGSRARGYGGEGFKKRRLAHHWK